MTKIPNDTERLDFLQKLTDNGQYTKRVIMRISSTDRGWRLHESELDDAVNNVRETIDAFMKGKSN